MHLVLGWKCSPNGVCGPLLLETLLSLEWFLVATPSCLILGTGSGQWANVWYLLRPHFHNYGADGVLATEKFKGLYYFKL